MQALSSPEIPDVIDSTTIQTDSLHQLMATCQATSSLLPRFTQSHLIHHTPCVLTIHDPVNYDSIGMVPSPPPLLTQPPTPLRRAGLTGDLMT